MPSYLDYPDCRAAAAHPFWIGDGTCDHGYYNTLECGFDGGDCEPWNASDSEYWNAKFPNCNTEYLAELGTSSCLDNYGANTAECDFDGGNCYYSNFMKKYPNCVVYNNEILMIGDDVCDGEYNTAECGFDLGDCVKPNPFLVWSVVGGVVAGAFLFIAIAIGIVVGEKKWNTSTMQETADGGGGGGVQTTDNAKDDMNTQQEEPFPDVEATATLGRELGSEARSEERSER